MISIRYSIIYKNFYWSSALALFLFLLLLPGTVAAALTMTAKPPTSNITPGLKNAIHISYTAQDLATVAFGGSATFAAISPQGLLQTEDGTVLETIASSVVINAVNYRGIATETLIVPARAITAALNAGKSRINYRRTFTTNTRAASVATVEVALWIAPSSAGQFSLTQMELEFNLPPSADLSRPSSGGRITVPRNTRGLGAVATLNYTGNGTLRGQWKVDNQVLQFVTLRLNPGQNEASVASPVVPDFPTYAGGLHKVEFEVIEPQPGFTEPAIYYFVTEQERLPEIGSLKLITPLERDRLEFGIGILPQFFWQAVEGGALYLLRIRSLDASVDVVDLFGDGLNPEKTLTAAVTRQPFFTLTPFDLTKIQPGRPYLWQVQAFRGTEMIAVSRDRLVYFVKRSETAKEAH